jgi:hypothetical protein
VISPREYFAALERRDRDLALEAEGAGLLRRACARAHDREVAGRGEE